MPLGPGVRYRTKTEPSGKEVRLAFRGNRVIEAKNLKTGHTATMTNGKTTHSIGRRYHTRTGR
jgi:hypothetical protein